nr:site-specific integrase [Bradyrhizobium sp. 172]
MVQQRNASAHTVRSYRDTWRLFLRFVAQRRRRPIAQLALGDLTASEVKTFLQYTEQERGDTIGTRNCRLSAASLASLLTASRRLSSNAPRFCTCP